MFDFAFYFLVPIYPLQFFSFPHNRFLLLHILLFLSLYSICFLFSFISILFIPFPHLCFFLSPFLGFVPSALLFYFLFSSLLLFLYLLIIHPLPFLLSFFQFPSFLSSLHCFLSVLSYNFSLTRRNPTK